MAVEPLLATRAQRAFIYTISLQAIIVLSLIGVIFRLVDEEVAFDTAAYKTLPCYLALFALAEIFEFLMAFDALRLRNIIQLIGITLFHLALLVSAALQVNQTQTALVTLQNCDGNDDYINCGGPGTLWMKIKPLLIVVPCIIGVAWVAMLFCIKQLYKEFGWAIFHVVGANPKMKTMYQWYQIMICLLKFDFFCFTGVTMQLLIVVLQTNSVEFGITIAAIPIVLVLLILCGFAVQREIKWLMSVSLVMMLASLSYLYKLVRFYEPSSQALYMTTRASLTVFTVVAFILLFSTFVVGLRCFSDFNRGLQPSKVNALYTNSKYLKNADSTGNMAEKQSAYKGGAPVGPRISIE